MEQQTGCSKKNGLFKPLGAKLQHGLHNWTFLLATLCCTVDMHSAFCWWWLLNQRGVYCLLSTTKTQEQHRCIIWTWKCCRCYLRVAPQSLTWTKLFLSHVSVERPAATHSWLELTAAVPRDIVGMWLGQTLYLRCSRGTRCLFLTARRSLFDVLRLSALPWRTGCL